LIDNKISQENLILKKNQKKQLKIITKLIKYIKKKKISKNENKFNILEDNLEKIKKENKYENEVDNIFEKIFLKKSKKKLKEEINTKNKEIEKIILLNENYKKQIEKYSIVLKNESDDLKNTRKEYILNIEKKNLENKNLKNQIFELKKLLNGTNNQIKVLKESFRLK
jgi:hypothetical protein